MGLKKKSVLGLDNREHDSFGLIYTTIVARWLASSIVLLGVFVALHPQVPSYVSSMMLGNSTGDGGIYVWLVESFIDDPARALRYDSNSFYPYPFSRAWSDNFLLPSAITLVLAKLGLSLETSYNSVILLAITLNGVAVAALARSIGLSYTLSLCAGALFMNSGYLLGNIGHPQLQFFFWVPLCWSLLIRRSPPLVTFLLAGLCITGAFYSAVYFAVFAAFGVGIVFLYQILIGSYRISSALLGAGAIFLGMLPILPSVAPYLAVKALFGSRGLYEAEAFAATGLSYLTMPHLTFFSNLTATWTHPEATLCTGYIALALAAWTVAYTGIRSSPLLTSVFMVSLAILAVSSSVVDLGMTSETVICLSAWSTLVFGILASVRYANPAGLLACITVIFFVLSFGPGGNPSKGEPSYAPFALLYHLAPGFDAVRAVSRFGIVVVMSVYIGACAAYARWVRIPSLRSFGTFSTLVIITLAENYLPALVTGPRQPAPQVFREIESLTRPNEAIIVLPFAPAQPQNGLPSWSGLAELNTRAMQWAVGIDRHFVNGYSGQRSKLHSELPAALAEFPSLKAHAALSRICGVTWIVLIPRLIDGFDLDTFREKLSRLTDQFQVVHTAPDGSILIRVMPASHMTPSNHPFIMAPSGRAISIAISRAEAASDKPDCMATLSRIEKAPSGELVRQVIRELSTPSSTVFPSEAPISRDTTRPTVFDIEPRGCEVVVGCGGPPP